MHVWRGIAKAAAAPLKRVGDRLTVVRQRAMRWTALYLVLERAAPPLLPAVALKHIDPVAA